MRFDYASSISAAADTGEPIAVFRPEIRITLHGPNGVEDIDALVDTGADNTILPESVARHLGIPLVRATGPAAQAFGGHELALSYADVELEIVHPSGSLRWFAHVYFAAAAHDDEDQVALLGRDGVLEYFTANFIGDEFALELEPNEYLPRAPGREHS
jgi:hypothetical protein